MVGELSGLRRASAKARSSELLERFDLDRRRRPGDEGLLRRHATSPGPRSRAGHPASGVVPRRTDDWAGPDSRVGMWEVIRELVADGATLLLTTQYLEEADELADRIVVIDHGTVIAAGTSPS